MRLTQLLQTQILRNVLNQNHLDHEVMLRSSWFSLVLLLTVLFVSGNALAVDTDSDGLDDDVELSLVNQYPFGSAQNLSSTVDGAYVVVEADIDGDGDLDVVLGQYIDQDNGVISWFENDGSGNFSAVQLITPNTTTVPGLRSIVAADINGDGFIDIVSADAGHISWFKNDGNANPTFSARINIDGYPNVLYAYSVAVGDLDNDGDIDIASAHIGSVALNVDDGIAWYANGGGLNPTFGSQQIISPIGDDDPVSIVLADVGGSSSLDVIVGSTSVDKIAWFENLGGNFAAEVVITNIADGVFDLTVADIDGDNDVDVISASQNDDKVAWYPNNGNGTWGPQNIISTTGDVPISVITSDLDGDGDADVIAASNADNTVSWYENNGSGTFGSQNVITALADGAQSVAIGDFDGNTAPDVVSAASIGDSVDWYRNPATDPNNPDTDGDGINDGDEVNTYNTNPNLTDSDGDGLTDGDEVNVYLTDPALTDTDGDGLNDSDEVNVFSTNPLLADTDSDGLNDGDEVNTYNTDPLIDDTDGDGLLDGFEVSYGFNPLLGGEQSLDPDSDGLDNTAEQTQGTNPIIADTDGDGASDGDEVNVHTTNPLAIDTDGDGMGDGFEITYGFDPTASNGEELLDGDSDGLNNLQEYNAGSNPTLSDTDSDGISDYDEVNIHGTDPAKADTDGDGVDDNTEINTYSTDPLNADTDGDGLGDGFEITYGFNPTASTGEELLDGDGDGLNNLGEYVAGTNPTLSDSDGDGLNDGEELSLTGAPHFYAFQAQQIISSNANSAYDVISADIDGDGDADVISASRLDNKIAWYANDGAGNMGAEQVISSTAMGAQAVAVADFDGDGDLDVVSASYDDDKIAWYANNGSGVFGTEQVITLLADGAEDVAVGDLDGINGIDVVSVSSNDDIVAWYANDGSGNFGAQQVIDQITVDASAGAIKVAVADFSKTAGDPDVVVASYMDDTIAWYENKINAGGADWAGRDVITSNALSVSDIDVADFDGDGRPDVVSASFDDDKIAWYENKQDVAGGSWGAEVVITTNASGASSVTSADIDNDGDIDVFTGSSFADEIAWYENTGPAGVFDPVPSVISSLAANVNSVAAADLDGDGAIDVLSASIDDDKIAWYRSPATKPAVADTDGDGLSDGDEVNIHMTDPLNNDTDGDGLLDDFEISYGFDPLTAGEEILDGDGDGLNNLAEQTAGTNPTLADTDSDGLTDGEEVNTYLTDPLSTDTDSDGLSDGDEVNVHGTDPTLADTDADGLSDSEEINTYLTDPNNPDTDGDGVTDGDEVTNGTDPLAPNTIPGDVAPYGATDGLVNTADLLVLQRMVLGEITPTANEIAAGDLNGNGVLDAGDLVLLSAMVI